MFENQEIINTYIRNRLSYETLAYTTSKYLDSELRKKLIDVTYIIWRIKKIDSILEKFERKKIEPNLTNIIDVVGIANLQTVTRHY